MKDLIVFPLDQVLTTFTSHSKVVILGDPGHEMATAASRAAADVSSDPPPEKLSDMLTADTNQAATSTAVAVGPASISAEEMQNLKDILLLNSYISVASMRYLYKQNPKGWDITDPVQAADYTRQATNAKFRILTEGMGGFLSQEQSSDREMHKTVVTAEVHAEFLAELFAGFNFPEAAMAELDSVLTSVTKQLASLKMSWSDQGETLDHMIFVFFFDKVAGLDYKLPRMRLFYLHIDQKTWQLAVGKSKVGEFSFHMNYTDSIFMMDPEQVEAQRTNINNLITKMTNMSLDSINDLISPAVVKNTNQS